MNQTAEKPRGWTPVAAGDIYCSPACGMGCTRKEYDEAVASAAALAQALGNGWEPRVWENLAWHYKARKGTCEVFLNGRDGTYMAMLNTSRKGVQQTIGRDPDPVLAVANAVSDLRKAHAAITAALAEWQDGL